jgi:hypothetical protein
MKRSILFLMLMITVSLCGYGRRTGKTLLIEAEGTSRVMRTGGCMGEIVGMAASLCKKYGTTPRGVYQVYLTKLKSHCFEISPYDTGISGRENKPYWPSIQETISSDSGTVLGGMDFTQLPFSSIRNFWKFHVTSASSLPFSLFSVSHLYKGAMSSPFTEIFCIIGKVTP